MQHPTFTDSLVFRGAAQNPFLAPRGVFFHQGKLWVADTGQNRVFMWHNTPSEGQEPDLVLGQTHTTHTGRNAQGEVSANSLQYPSGIWSDGQKLIVADAWNHRVLIWLQLPTQHGQSADVVIGQPDFVSNQPNVQGLNHRPSAQSLYWCYGVCSDGQSLWIADTGNRRVLFFKEIPTTSFAAADAVIGQTDFSERDYDPANAIWPYSVKVGPQGELAIVDTQFYRVLLWHNASSAFQQPADVLIGQPDFAQNGQNQFSFFPQAHTLSWCYDVCFYRQGLWIADTGNSRVLGFHSIPQRHNQPADLVIGQPNFTTGSENKDTIQTTENTLYWPFSLQAEGQQLAIADTGNHRIMIQDLNTIYPH